MISARVPPKMAAELSKYQVFQFVLSLALQDQGMSAYFNIPVTALLVY